MSKNREPVKPVEPETDSSEEEEEDDEGSTEVSESEPEPTQLTKKPLPPQHGPSEDEESGSESDRRVTSVVAVAKTVSKPPQPQDEESVSESESESDSDQKVTTVISVAKTPAAASKPPGDEESGSESESDSDPRVTSVVAVAKTVSKPPQPEPLVDEVSGSESSESESESDSNQKVTTVVAVAKTPATASKPSGDEESESESESDSDRKVTSVAMDSDVLKSSNTISVLKPLTPSKRLADQENEKEAKKSKKADLAKIPRAEEEDDDEVSKSDPEPNQLMKKSQPPGDEESESESESDSDQKVTSVAMDSDVLKSSNTISVLKTLTPSKRLAEENEKEAKKSKKAEPAKIPLAEEEDDDQGSTEVSKSEPEPNQLAKKPELNQLTKKPSPSEDEEESGSESESKSESVSNRKVTSVAQDSATLSVLKPLTPSKRLADQENEKEAKKSKKASILRRFQRLWSEEDEIVLIKGMIDYSENKADPFNDADSFLESIKNSLKIVNLTKTQLLAKMRRIKQKYENNSSKEKTTFSNPHERNAFELSKILWGKKNVNKENRGKRVSSVVNNVVGVEDKILMLGEQMFKEGKLGEEWEKLEREEFEGFMRQWDAKTRRLKLVMDNLN